MVEASQQLVSRVVKMAGLLPLLIVAVAGTGCHQGHYRARSLPPEMAASPAPNMQTLDLSQLGGQTFDGQRIYPGDVLDVQVITGAETTEARKWELRVRDDGAVNVPLVGPVVLAGLDLPSAEHAIQTASIQRQVFRRPAVGLSVNERRTNEVVVAGAVNEPKAYQLPTAGSTLMSALLTAGGLAETAGRYVEIRQPAAAPSTRMGPTLSTASYSALQANRSATEPQVLRVDLLSATANGGGDIYLNDGAVVTVEQQPPRFVHVIGLVRQQQRLEVPPGENLRLTDALALAGGTSMSPVIADKVHIVRKRPDSEETFVITASIREAKKNSRENILLAADDVVAVEETPITFTLGTLQGLMGIGVNGMNQLR